MSVLIKDHSLDYIPKLESLQKIDTLETSTPATEKIQESLHHSQADFSRWRPTFHLLAPHGWLNDPCGPGYDLSTGKYHLAFQWNPNGNDWGDISWGYSESTDLVNWETSSRPCLSPSAWYDCKGIFTGCFHPSSTSGQQDGTLTYIYTSVNHLPIHYTLPYEKGCESLSIAESHDGGATWNRKPCNPILPGPPKDLPVTGWRDPFICPSWPSALAHLPRTRDGEEVLCGLIAGGLVNHTPTVFVYTVKKNDLTDWKYAGMLADTGLNFRPSRWSGDFGVNWEVANLVTLKDDEGTSRDFVIMGTEGCLPGEEHYPSGHDSIARQKRTQRSQLWMCMKSNETSPSSPALAQYSFAGIFDNGLYYAANSFWDPVSNQQVVFGWITEEDLPDGPRHRQGWSGLISLPRVLKLQTMHRVKRARSTTEMGKITSIETIPDDRGTFTIRTLGIAPDKRLEKLRQNAHQSSIADMKLEPLSGLGAGRNNPQFLPLTTLQWEVEAEIQVGKNCSRTGFAICDGSDKTILYWDPISENFIVDRPDPRTKYSKDSDAGINHGPELSPHTLFTRVVDSQENDNCHEIAATEIEETLKIRAIFDVSVLEVFVNERTAISTRIYRSNNSDTQTSDEPGRFGIYFFADGAVHDEADGNTEDDSAARLVHAAVWDGISAH